MQELREIETEFIAKEINSKIKITSSNQNEFEKLIKGCNTATKRKLRVAYEMGVRSISEKSLEQKQHIQFSSHAYTHFKCVLNNLDHEEFWVLFLNRSLSVIGKEQLSKGGICSSIVDVRILFRKALEHKATAIMIAHNHPSGNTKPSEADINITTQIKKAGKILNIDLLDHLIIGCNNYISMADDGML